MAQRARRREGVILGVRTYISIGSTSAAAGEEDGSR